MKNEGEEIKEEPKNTKVEKNVKSRKKYPVPNGTSQKIPGPKCPKILKTVWSIFVKIATIAIVLICIIIVIQKVTNNKESFFGYRIFRVQTGSMIPKYQVGDVILVKEKAIDKIKIGDDVTYQGVEGVVKGILITHRVIDIENIDGQLAFHTQGIANNLEDPVVYGDQINGVVQFKMPILTLICKMLNNKYIFYFCGILPLTIYVFFRVFKGSYDTYDKRFEKN